MRKRSQMPPPGFEPEAVASAPESTPEHDVHAQRVEQVSSELREELDANARKEARTPSDLFERRNRRGKESPLNPEIERIVETIVVDRPFEEYQRLEAAIKIGDKRTDHGSVNKSLDEAESNCRMAHRLWMTARIEKERWEKENAIIFAAMRDEATKTLQREKAEGLRNKQITDADVDSMCALIFGDEWKSQETKRRKVDAMVKSMENLNDCWLSRCRSLQAMLAKQR